MVYFEGVEDVEGLAALVVESMADAHENLSAAQATSRQRGEGVYGQIWRSLCHELATRLRAERLDVQVIKPAGIPYELLIVGDAVLFPWRPAGGHTPTSIAFGTSPTRRRLWSQTRGQGLLPFEAADVVDDDGAGATVDDLDEPAAVLADVVEEVRRKHLRVVIVAMTSDARRMRSIEWGEAEVDDDGVLAWAPETLYFLDAAITPASTSSETFADGEAPTPGVTLKPKSEPGKESTDGE